MNNDFPHVTCKYPAVVQTNTFLDNVGFVACLVRCRILQFLVFIISYVEGHVYSKCISYLPPLAPSSGQPDSLGHGTLLQVKNLRQTIFFFMNPKSRVEL